MDNNSNLFRPFLPLFFRHAFLGIGANKESYSRVNGSKQQLNSFIIYGLDSIARVNEICKNCKKKKKCELPRLDLALFERPIRNLNPVF